MQFVSEINTVIQYYEVEVEEEEDIDWDVVIVHDDIPVEAEKFKNGCEEKIVGSVQLCSSNTVYENTPLEVNNAIEAASITAVGHALKSFNIHQLQAKINLLPPETEDVRNTKKYALITANVAVVILLVMFAGGALIRNSLGKTQYAIEQRKANDPVGNIEALLKKQKKITEQIAFFSSRKKEMNEVFADYSGVKWHDLLHDIRTRTPVALYLTRLTCSENMTIMLEGNAVSFKAIHIFAKLLTQSDYFKAASVAETNKSNTEGLVAFTVRVELVD
jgi:Tfp pilus assembly protein PilN